MTVTTDFDPNAPLLDVDDVVIEYETRADGRLVAVDGVSFTVGRDETFGLVGESGCGKSTVAKAVLGLLPKNGHVTGGEIRYRGVDVASIDREQLNEIRWEHVSLISQGAMNALNPVHRISTQIVEAIQAHRDASKDDARERVGELFELVGLDPERMDDYPHQFSGGMKQRAYIAMALALEPDLIVADEPTTALDVIVQDQILKRINELKDQLDVSMLLISHDISVIAETCDRMGVMYSGHMMEHGDIKSLFRNPYNPYTLGLQNAFPTLFGEQKALVSIPGNPPDIAKRPSGCQFAGRCPFATDRCLEAHPEVEQVGEDHFSACYRHDIIEDMRRRAPEQETWTERQTGPAEREEVADD